MISLRQLWQRPEYFRLWEAAVIEADDPLLPLKFGASISTEAFEPPVFAAMCSANLNEALYRLALYKRLFYPIELRVDVSSQQTSLKVLWLDMTITPPAYLVVAELIYFVQLARIGTRAKVEPLAFKVPVLPEASTSYNEYLGISVTKAETPELIFRAEDAVRPFLTANAPMWDFFESNFKKLSSELDASVSVEERVRAALLELIPSGHASIDRVAKKLGMSVRTAQRRLYNEGKSFQLVLNETRTQLAQYYLKNSSLSGSEIAFLLGFEDPNSFYRAFHDWTGQTLSDYRTSVA